ncbi:S4 domain protein [Metalysinibacillus saudimassiliensis]|uniref:S4 domain protein n=1 Tax=Metalysinibacillus saudimassiliensis TaxID=1461583 RepID=A0A078MD26_9BACL|nr:S4 domain protein [Metalysinibacillus saudimassiliensis]
MDNIIQHFRSEERPFIEQVMGWQREVEDRYAPKLTDFLDPRERFIVQAIIQQREDIGLAAEGGFVGAERQRMLIYPSYYEPTIEDFAITLFSIHYATKFVTLEHPQILGTLLSNGVERKRFGDIRLADDCVQFAVSKEMSEFLRLQVTSVGKAKVSLEEISLAQALPQVTEEWQEQMHTVSSMRLDVVLASALSISRQKVQQLITAGRVKVNHTVREDRAFELQEEDLLSVRGYGRLKVLAIEGRTRKQKIKVILGTLLA